jgi:hypothetical protein
MADKNEMQFIKHIFNKHKAQAALVMIGAIALVLYFITRSFAISGGPFTPNETLDPNCVPGGVCKVNIFPTNASGALTNDGSGGLSWVAAGGGGGATVEGKTIALSANGNVASINGVNQSNSNYKVRFDVDIPGSVGTTQVVCGTGQGIISAVSGNTITVDTITVFTGGPGFPASGGTCTYTNLITFVSISGINMTSNPVWILTIPTTSQLKLAHLNAGKQTPSFTTSTGESDGTIQDSISSGFGFNASNLLYLFDNPNGWSGQISAINPSSFDITFTKIGSGLDLAGKLHLIEG